MEVAGDTDGCAGTMTGTGVGRFAGIGVVVANGSGVSARITRSSGRGSRFRSGSSGGRNAVTMIITMNTSTARPTMPARM